MQTRSSSRLVSNPFSNPTPSTNLNLKGRNRGRSKQRIEEFNLDELYHPIVTMADQRTMAQLLQAPTEGYDDAIVVPAITADNFELKHGLLTLVTNKQFFGHNKEDLHAHIRYFNKITSTLKFPNVLNTEAWDRFKDLLRACPHHGFSKLYQLDTFYNALNSKDQDSLNSQPVVAKVSTNTFTSGISPDVAELKDMVKALPLDKKATDGNVYRDNIQEFVSQASAVNYNQGNTSYRLSMMSNQIRPPGFPPVPNNQNVQRNNQNRFIPNQNRGNNFNQRPIYQPSIFQPSAYQALAYQAPAPQTQGVSKEDFLAYVKANDAVMRNIAFTSSSGTLPSNTIANLRSVYSLISEPVIAPVSTPKPNPKSSIPYPSRRNDERNREKANNQTEKFYQIFKDMSLEISFTVALILMPKFASTLKALIGNKEKLSKMARTPLKEHCSAVLLKKLPKKLGDPCKFLIPCDFPRMAKCLALAYLGASINLMPYSVWKRLSLPDLTPTYFDAEPRVPLILRRSFLKTGKALIDVFEVLGFFDVIASGNPTPYYDPIVSTTSPTLTPFGNIDFLLEEVDAFLATEDDPTSLEFYQPYLDHEGDILLLESFLNDDPSPPLNQGNYLPEVRKELKICEAKSDKSLIDEPSEVKLKDLPLHLEYAFLEGDNKLPVIIAKYLSVEEKTALITVLKSHKRAIAWKLSDIKGAFQRCMLAIFHDMIEKTMEVFMDDFSENSHFMVKEGIVLGHKISKQWIEVDKAKVDVITKLPHPTTVKGIRSFLGHAGFYRRFIKDFSKIARPITRLLEKDTPFIFSQECVEAFQTLKRKLTEAPILIAPDWDIPFELMCDGSEFAIGAVLGQCQDKHFRPIHYGSKTMTEAKSNYTITEKEMLAVVYAFEKFQSYLIMNKSIVYTDHSTLKYLFAKKDSKARLL
nr:reverse transcriptase domain-containing protein [Tanacetum cinerariifolium]